MAMQESNPTLIEFYKPGCKHCEAMQPIMKDLRDEMYTRANIMQVDISRFPSIPEEFDVRSYPTWIMYKDGQEVWRDAGEKPLSELKDMILRFV